MGCVVTKARNPNVVMFMHGGGGILRYHLQQYDYPQVYIDDLLIYIGAFE